MGLASGCLIIAASAILLLVAVAAFGYWRLTTQPLFPGMSPLPRPEARLLGRLTLDPGQEEGGFSVRMRIPAGALPAGVEGVDPTAYLELDPEVEADGEEQAGDSQGPSIEVSITDVETARAVLPMAPVETGADVRWTASCAVGTDCEITFEIGIRRGAGSPDQASLEVGWRLTVELRHARGVTLAEGPGLSLDLVGGER
jgi:hypothetical protein